MELFNATAKVERVQKIYIGTIKTDKELYSGDIINSDVISHALLLITGKVEGGYSFRSLPSTLDIYEGNREYDVVGSKFEERM